MLLAPHLCPIVCGALLNDFELAHHVQKNDFLFFAVHESGEAADQLT